MQRERDRYLVYILECSDGTLYTGITNDINRRVEQHNGKRPGGAQYTRTRSPVRVVYTEECKGRSDALKREHTIKNLPRMEKVKLLQTGI